MSDTWLDIRDADIDTAKVVNQIRERMTARSDLSSSPALDEDPVAIADRLRKQMIESNSGDALPISEPDCDIVPRNYVIDWRVPILGPIHAWVRRIINAEVRRYLALSLERQSYLNRQMLSVLNDLVSENKRLRQRLDDLEEGQG